MFTRSGNQKDQTRVYPLLKRLFRVPQPWSSAKKMSNGDLVQTFEKNAKALLESSSEA